MNMADDIKGELSEDWCNMSLLRVKREFGLADVLWLAKANLCPKNPVSLQKPVSAAGSNLGCQYRDPWGRFLADATTFLPGAQITAQATTQFYGIPKH